MSRKLIKTYPQLAGLSNFSLEVAQWINKLRSSWLGYAKAAEWKGENYLKIAIPPKANLPFPTMVID